MHTTWHSMIFGKHAACESLRNVSISNALRQCRTPILEGHRYLLVKGPSLRKRLVVRRNVATEALYTRPSSCLHATISFRQNISTFQESLSQTRDWRFQRQWDGREGQRYGRGRDNRGVSAGWLPAQAVRVLHHQIKLAGGARLHNAVQKAAFLHPSRFPPFHFFVSSNNGC